MHAGFCFWRQRLDGPAREDIQSELPQADRFVHSAEGIQKTGSELTLKRFPLRMRRAVQCPFHKYLLNHRLLWLVSSRRFLRSASDKAKSKASMLAARCTDVPHPTMGTTLNRCERRNASTTAPTGTPFRRAISPASLAVWKLAFVAYPDCSAFSRPTSSPSNPCRNSGGESLTRQLFSKRGCPAFVTNTICSRTPAAWSQSPTIRSLRCFSPGIQSEYTLAVSMPLPPLCTQ